MKLSVVILNYNVANFLELCIQSVVKATQNIDSEIIVVDNASSDSSVAMVEQHFPQVKLIANTENTGFPNGNNMGVAIAQGEYLCILNPDTVVAEDTFVKFLDFANDKADLGIAGPKLIDGAGNFLPESKRGIPTPWVAFTKFLELYNYFPKWFGKYYFMQLDENTIGKVEILVGAFMFMKRQLYIDLGGFDERCFMYSDDIDLSYTSLTKGYANYYFPETNVIHYKGESTAKDETFLIRFREAMNFFYRKHFRANFIFDLMMRVGAKIFSMMKLIKMKQHSEIRIIPDQYFLVSNSSSLAEKIEFAFKKPVITVALEDLEGLVKEYGNHKTVEIIFDAGTLAFKEMITAFTRLKKKGYTFKIRPENKNFIVGSNFSDAKGEVKYF